MKLNYSPPPTHSGSGHVNVPSSPGEERRSKVVMERGRRREKLAAGLNLSLDAFHAIAIAVWFSETGLSGDVFTRML